MQRAMLDAPIVATDDWYCSADVVDHSAMASSMEWTELLAAHAAAANGGPAVERRRLKDALTRGVPDAMRARVWLAFSGAAERL